MRGRHLHFDLSDRLVNGWPDEMMIIDESVDTREVILYAMEASQRSILNVYCTPTPRSNNYPTLYKAQNDPSYSSMDFHRRYCMRASVPRT